MNPINSFIKSSERLFIISYSYRQKLQKFTQLLLGFNLIFLILNLPIERSTAAPPDFISTCPKAPLSELPQPPLSQTKPSLPSLWLADNFFGEEILNTWFVNSDDTWVILIVNSLIWRRQDYLAHYQFVNHFGTVARQYGYNLKVCQILRKKPIAAYICDFETAPLNCRIELESRFGSSFLTPLKKFPILENEQ